MGLFEISIFCSANDVLQCSFQFSDWAADSEPPGSLQEATHFPEGGQGVWSEWK